jgi:hypothetical protein
MPHLTPTCHPTTHTEWCSMSRTQCGVAVPPVALYRQALKSTFGKIEVALTGKAGYVEDMPLHAFRSVHELKFAVSCTVYKTHPAFTHSGSESQRQRQLGAVGAFRHLQQLHDLL